MSVTSEGDLGISKVLTFKAEQEMFHRSVCCFLNSCPLLGFTSAGFQIILNSRV